MSSDWEQPLLYQQIAEAVRQEVLRGQLAPGTRLPSLRELATRWGCTVGTAQRAYHVLTREGLIVSRPGQGSSVAQANSSTVRGPLRLAKLTNRIEAFLLELSGLGHGKEDLEEAIQVALDRVRAAVQPAPLVEADVFRFVGSHDIAVAHLATLFPSICPLFRLHVTYAGSLGGLIALARGEADLAGSHLWDDESGSYNTAFVSRLLPNTKVFLLTLAERDMGLVVRPSNPRGVRGLDDLARKDLRFVNRQPGAGTRVWLDSRLRLLGMVGTDIVGYEDQRRTHTEVAQSVAEGQADVGLAILPAARTLGLDFIPLAKERYELVGLSAAWATDPLRAIQAWLVKEETRGELAALGGYDTDLTGSVRWLS